MESVNNHWQQRTEFKSDGNNKTKQNSPKDLKISISTSKGWPLIKQEEHLLLFHSLWKPVIIFFVSMHKRYMCSFSVIITGPPRFSFQFHMRSGMFRLAHLCSQSAQNFHWQILVSPNLGTINALKNLQIFHFKSPIELKICLNFFCYYSLEKLRQASPIRKQSWISTYPKYNVRAWVGAIYFCSMIFPRMSRSKLSSRPFPLWKTE